MSWTTPAGGSVTADNGLTINPANNVQLGGTLIQNTLIDQAGFDTTFTNGSFYHNRTSGPSVYGLENGNNLLGIGLDGNMMYETTTPGVFTDLNYVLLRDTGITLGATLPNSSGQTSLSPSGSYQTILTDAATNGRDIVNEVEKSLKEAGISVSRFAHITGKSLDITADSAVDEIKKNGSDFIVAIGGNTVMEGAKLIASAAARTLGRAMMPLNFVPTTYHAGACFDASLPDGSRDNALLAKVVLVDPDCMTGMSQKDRAVSGFAALCECIRAYTAPDAQPLTDAMALYAIDILNDKLVGVCGENTDKGAWEKVVLAGVIGSMVSAETGCQVAKDLKQAVAKTSFAADEVLLAAIVPVVVDAKAGKDPFLYGKLARTMGGFTSDDCAARLCYLAKALHLDLRIADMGVHEDDIANLAEAYMGEEAAEAVREKAAAMEAAFDS